MPESVKRRGSSGPTIGAMVGLSCFGSVVIRREDTAPRTAGCLSAVFVAGCPAGTLAESTERECQVASMRGIFIAVAVAGALAVASPAMADEGDRRPAGDPVSARSTGDQPDRVVEAADGDPLPGGDPVSVPSGPDRVVDPAEGDPLPGGDPVYVPSSDDQPDRVVEPAEGDPLPGGDPRPAGEPAQARMTATFVFTRAERRHVRRHARHVR